METTEPMPSPSSSVSQDDRGGLWMEAESHPEEEAGNAEDSPSLTSTSGGRTSGKVAAQLSSVPLTSNELEDEEDDVFVLPALCTAPSLPAEGSGGAVEHSVRVPDGWSSVTGTQVNPLSLDGKRGERHDSTSLVKEENRPTGRRGGGDEDGGRGEGGGDEDGGRGEGGGGEEQEVGKHGQGPGSKTETSSAPAPPIEEIQATECLPSRGKVEEGAGQSHSCPSRDTISMEVLGTNTDLALSPAKETEEATSPVSEEGSSDRTLPSKEIQEPTGESIPPEEDSGPEQPCSSPDDSIGEPEPDPVLLQKTPCGPPELCQCEKDEESDNDAPAEESDTDMEKVDGRLLDYSETKQLWVRRESTSSESSKPPLSISREASRKGLIGTTTASDQQGEVEEEAGVPAVPTHLQAGEAEKGADVSAVPTYLQQGEELLHRLYEVQKRQQDQQVSKEPPPSQQGARDTTNEDKGEHEVDGSECMRVGGEEGEGVRDLVAGQRDQGESELLPEKEREVVSQVEREEAETGQDVTTTDEHAQAASSVLVGPSSASVPMETDACDDDHSDSGMSAALSPLSTQEVHSIQTSVQTIQTTIQTSIQPVAQSTNQTPLEEGNRKNQSFRSSRCQSDTDQNLDVMEIPFKSSTLLSMPLQPPRACAAQGADWQFSDKKIPKETSQEIQKEPWNLGKIPGVYSKSSVVQLKEKKLLFEAFQQGITEGLTRHRKIPPYFSKGLGTRGHVYPSVLERTRSLEVFHNKTCSLPRTSSLRLQRSTESCSGSNRSAERQPLGKWAKRQVVIVEGDTPLDKERRQRLSRSMDSLRLEDGEEEGTEGEGTTKRGEKGGAGETSKPALAENPFFKLRPALALKPEVEKDIQEAREREEELRRQRCSLYGKRLSTEDRPSSPPTVHPGPSVPASDLGLPSKGKLDRAWPPPPSRNIKESSGHIQEPRGSKAGGPKTRLWQRWEAGLVNGQQPK